MAPTAPDISDWGSDGVFPFVDIVPSYFGRLLPDLSTISIVFANRSQLSAAWKSPSRSLSLDEQDAIPRISSAKPRNWDSVNAGGRSAVLEPDVPIVFAPPQAAHPTCLTGVRSD